MEFLVLVALIGYIAYASHTDDEEESYEEEMTRRAYRAEKERKETPCHFDKGLSQEQFEKFVRKATKRIKRITRIDTSGPVIYGTVESQSGISEWDFEIDFNDYGHVTGKYWLYSDNDDSSIPNNIANNISSMIQDYYESFDQESEDETSFEQKNSYTSDTESTETSYNRCQSSTDNSNYKPIFGLKKVSFVILMVCVLIIGAMILGVHHQIEESKKIEVGISSKELKGIDYQQAVSILEKNGFTNITAEPSYDLVLGWINKDKSVKSVSIGGDKKFSEEDRFAYDAKVIVKYHTFKKNKKE